MPLFANKFSPKKGMPRKASSMSNLNLDATERQSEFGIACGPVKMRLGSNEMIFDGTDWVSETSMGGGGSGGSQREVLHLKRQNQQLNEENNLLKIKMDLLLDMLSERTAEIHMQENEIDQLKKLAKKR